VTVAEALHELLDRVSNLVRTEMRHAAASAGLELVQLEALRYLTRCNRYSDTPSAVAEYLGLTRGTVSQSLRALEIKGLIVKQLDESDRRVTHCRTTPAGRRLVASAYPATGLRTVMGAAPGIVGDTLRSLRELLRELQTAGGHHTFGPCRTCSHLCEEGDRFRCGLTGERLVKADTLKICREHTPPPLGATG
jgi:DNA-binding MarR family transcriptional regulator